MTEREIKHHFAHGVYAKEQFLPKGEKVDSHRHVYDHISILAKGKAKVTCEGVTVQYEAPACVVIKKGVKHTIEADEDAVWYCIHATEITEPSRVDDSLIERG